MKEIKEMKNLKQELEEAEDMLEEAQNRVDYMKEAIDNIKSTGEVQTPLLVKRGNEYCKGCNAIISVSSTRCIDDDFALMVESSEESTDVGLCTKCFEKRGEVTTPSYQ